MFRIRLGIALIGTAITLCQSLFIFFSGSGLCLNDGCEVVEELTRVSPLIFNLAGFLFFQAVFWTLVRAGKRSEVYLNVPRVLLLAALCAEGVLLSFQWQIANTFCSYCLIIFLCIVLLNLLSGTRHIIIGLVLFLFVVVASFSLNWKSGGTGKSLDGGSIAYLAGQAGSGGGYLFFSQNCRHCEEIIDLLKDGNTCEIYFNPVDRITDFSFSAAERTDSHDLQINLQFLKMLAISEIPVFVTNDMPNSQIIRGTSAIEQYLSEFCTEMDNKDFSGFSSALPSKDFILNVEEVEKDGCPVDQDCERKTP